MAEEESDSKHEELVALPEVGDLWRRHPGLTEVVAGNYAEARDVVMTALHTSPTRFDALDEQYPHGAVAVAWRTASARQQAAWANTDDATRDAAYGVALAYVELQFQLFAAFRADRVTGCDYYLTPRSDEP